MDTFAWIWIAAPAVALLAACIALVPLGSQVLTRGVVFIDLAIAQLAACGAIASGIIFDHAPLWVTSSFTAVTAIFGAVAVRYLANQWPAQREALIGLVYVIAASAALLAITLDPHGRERLTALLAADVLWADWYATALLAAMAIVVAFITHWRYAWWQRDDVFYVVFALTLSAAVPVLGLYLVFALLIGPALWTRLIRPRPIGLFAACSAAAAACLWGMLISWVFDWPSGACIACSVGVLGLAAALCNRSKAD